MKKAIAILGGIFITSAFLSQVFSQKELEVMKRYDYSSPKASYESLKKAIQNKDFEGIAIHMWQLTRIMASYSNAPQISFEEFVRNIERSERCSPASLVKDVEKWYSGDGGFIKLTETDFLEESERIPSREDIGVTMCTITAQRKSDGKKVLLNANNLNGTNEWWIFIYPGGE